MLAVMPHCCPYGFSEVRFVMPNRPTAEDEDMYGGAEAPRERHEESGTWRIPITVSVLVSLVGVCINYGVNANRISELERRVTAFEMSRDSNDSRTDARMSIMQDKFEQRISASETAVAVSKTEYTEIIRRLDGIEQAIREETRRSATPTH